MSTRLSAADAYRNEAFENAPPIKVVRMMYEGALRFLDQAAQLDPETRFADYSERLRRAESVVCELRLALDEGHSPELCSQLVSLYLFVEEQLQRATLERKLEPLAPAREVLATLLDGWSKLEVGA